LPSVTIVGASIAGLALARWLRQLDYRDRIVLLGDEDFLPYNRTALTKEAALTGESEANFQLASEVELRDLNIDFRSGTVARELELDKNRIRLESKKRESYIEPYETLVIATGLSAKRLTPDIAGALSLRSLNDLSVLRNAAKKAKDALVVGSGVLGAEISGVLASSGLSVTMVGKGSALTRSFGARATNCILGSLDRVGVTRVTDELVAVAKDQKGFRLLMRNGETRAAELLITAIGSSPNSGWLAGSGITLIDGLVETNKGQAAPNIWAIGDVAFWLGEDRANLAQVQARAISHARLVAHQLVGLTPPQMPAHYAWTQICGTKVQALGQPGRSDNGQLLAENGERFVQLHTLDGKPVGLSSYGMPRDFTRARLEYEEIINDRSQK
jgi:NADPH-dependent 2,4-dienoyl-CoA reductase/sulfur reductase-like enzyme